MATTAEIARNAQNRAEHGVTRAVMAGIMERISPDGSDAYFQRRPDDEVTRILYRAAQNPGTLAASGWAAELASTATTQFVVNLGPLSGASQLFAAAMRPPFPPGTTELNVPSALPEGIPGAFIAEGDPIPVVSWDFAAATLRNKKLSFITAITRDLAKSRGAESMIDGLLRQSAALTLDDLLFSDDAATDAAPAGLFYDLEPTIPLSFDGGDQMINDLAVLASTVAPIGGDRLAFLSSPARALQISARAPALRYPVIASKSISDNRIAAVALDALAVAIAPTPEIEISQNAAIHMSNVPAELVADNGTVADPVRSLWQTATIGIRLILEMDWAKRDAGAVQYIEDLTW